MSVLDLPTETVVDIFGYLGPSYFQEDHKRLLISRKWYALACLICWSGLDLTAARLQRLVTVLNKKTDSHLLTKNLVRLSIKLSGNEDWRIPAREQSPGGPLHPYNHYNDYWGSAAGHAQLKKWTDSFNRDLTQFIQYIQLCPKLRMLCLHIFTEVNPHIDNFTRRTYISSTNVKSLLSVGTAHSITDLHLDLCGLNLEDPSVDTGTYHICTGIQPFLMSARNLRLRSNNICADALTPLTAIGPLPLKELIVNLSLSNESPGMLAGRMSRRCGADSNFIELYNEMKAAIEALTSRLTSPQLVRILFHNPVTLKMVAFDALTGKSRPLKNNSTWDGPVEEESSEEEETGESEIESLSDFDGGDQ